MRAHRVITVTLAIALLCFTTYAQAAPQVSINTIAEKQEIVTVDGEQQVRFVQAGTSLPGDTLRFTIFYSNSGDETATGVVLDNPVPLGAIYLANSATREGVDELLFSIDSGTTYKQPTLLTYTTTLANGDKETRVASPEEYTHIRWLINNIPPGGAGQVSYNALVE